MEKGIGDPNVDFNTSCRMNTNYSYHNRKSYVRMALFNDPLSRLFVTNWEELVKPD
jgi:hypothetical protein